jgi:hypothetical protein
MDKSPSVHSAVASDLDSETYNSFVEGLELASVEIVKLHAERTNVGKASETAFDLTASYMQDGVAVHYRYDLTACLTDGDGNSLGNIAASALVVTRAADAADPACIEQFGATSGILIAHPYLREAVASSAQRIGFPGVLPPMIKSQPADPTVAK